MTREERIASEPAFPTSVQRGQNGEYWTEDEGGLTKREHFAIEAMKGLLANPGGPIQASAQCGWSLTNCKREDVAGAAVRFADALIAELAK